MTSIAPLLTFPNLAPGAFSALKLAQADAGSPVEPPRKQARTSSLGANASRLLSTGGPKRIGIKNASFQLDPKRVPDKSDDPDRRLLCSALQTLLRPRSLTDPSPLPPIPSYRTLALTCEKLVAIQRAGEEVYSDVQGELGRMVRLVATELGEERHGNGTRATGVEWLAELVQRWEIFDKNLGIVRSFLLHVDQTYVLHQAPDKLPVRELGRQIFKDKILLHSDFQAKIQGGIADFLTQERASPEAKTEHRALFKPLSHILLTLDLYDLLLRPYLSSTTLYYIAFPDRVPHATPEEALAYLELADAKVTEEVHRAQEVLQLGGGTDGVRRAVEEGMLGSGLMSELSKLVLPKLLEERALVQLKLVHALTGRLSSLASLRVQFTAALGARVAGIISPNPPSGEADERMIGDLLALRKFADKLTREAFGEEPEDPTAERVWRNCVLDAFEKGFAGRVKKPAEMIAKYIDQAMRKGQRSASDEEFNRLLNEALGLYRFTKDRDVFREYYIRALAKRLLLQKSASDDFELNVLKILIDHDKFFEKGHGMFSDLALSRDMMGEWKNLRADRGDDEETLTVMVLQHSNWPTYSLGQVILPKQMEYSLSSFVRFYKSKHAQRKLDWGHSLGTVTLTGRFDAGAKELSVSLYQAVVLLLFEDGGSMNFQDIKEATGIEDKELRRTLQSLALGRKRVLTKVPHGKDVDDGDVFEYNAKFTDKNRRLHINSIQQAETAEESKQIEEHIEEDRTHALDAAIVRIMKARKRLGNNKLTEEVIIAVRAHFVPQPAQIKKQIESLIEREYITRSDGDRNTFEYVA
ncbi:Cullin-domain-containing protein [Calocera viscosa TUFC12733]|uniref:Cullin-domain-containing protein n=1 Tax=Calocera viscosa (strain TUFC12733) TaxID=1330018 RepID=A0A167QHR9_CALVF|nr:Cullin-domain-containing protein [Calocera viscosa TUFC12733]